MFSLPEIAYGVISAMGTKIGAYLAAMVGIKYGLKVLKANDRKDKAFEKEGRRVMARDYRRR